MRYHLPPRRRRAIAPPTACAGVVEEQDCPKAEGRAPDLAHVVTAARFMVRATPTVAYMTLDN